METREEVCTPRDEILSPLPCPAPATSSQICVPRGRRLGDPLFKKPNSPEKRPADSTVETYRSQAPFTHSNGMDAPKSSSRPPVTAEGSDVVHAMSSQVMYTISMVSHLRLCGWGQHPQDGQNRRAWIPDPWSHHIIHGVLTLEAMWEKNKILPCLSPCYFDPCSSSQTSPLPNVEKVNWKVPNRRATGYLTVLLRILNLHSPLCTKSFQWPLSDL